VTTQELTDSTELSDSDYPRVYGSPLDNLPGFTKPPAIAIIDNEKVCEILKQEGYNTQKSQVKALNFFHSPIDAFQYAFYHFGITDIYIVLMINKRKRSIYGYHVLDLTQEYSLSDDLVNRMKTKAMVL
jgi:hypothetical protein